MFPVHLIVLLDLTRPNSRELELTCRALFNGLSIGPFRAPERDWPSIITQIVKELRTVDAIYTSGFAQEECWKLVCTVENFRPTHQFSNSRRGCSMVNNWEAAVREGMARNWRRRNWLVSSVVKDFLVNFL